MSGKTLSLASSLLCLVFLAACGGGRELSAPSTVPRQVTVRWLGYECFQISSSLGLRVLTNPFYPDTVGATLPSSLSTDVLLVSTEDKTASNVDAIENSPAILRGAMGAGSYSASGLSFQGIPTNNGANLVFVWLSDEMRFCFSGNLKAPLTPSEVSQIGTVDVLFLAVGTSSALDESERLQLIHQLRPRVVIPMGPASAVASWSQPGLPVFHISGPTVFLSRDRLPPGPAALILGAP